MGRPAAAGAAAFPRVRRRGCLLRGGNGAWTPVQSRGSVRAPAARLKLLPLPAASGPERRLTFWPCTRAGTRLWSRGRSSTLGRHLPLGPLLPQPQATRGAGAGRLHLFPLPRGGPTPSPCAACSRGPLSSCLLAPPRHAQQSSWSRRRAARKTFRWGFRTEVETQQNLPFLPFPAPQGGPPDPHIPGLENPAERVQWEDSPKLPACHLEEGHFPLSKGDNGRYPAGVH
ncbi:uncharacterized protein LOC116545965 [Sapajus apella]|uniref:Uncharacterized protein LOC116545965 n=1 Tax=Sapajus apella TaxID=9515 RepID=A0A6J3HEV3_SAPAP|nr:uncharacterized protein LOC116545965 [Sapajus apella]XP_032128255.1 uncharacterized protein LOC116545965 [Sapajus apella]